MSDVPFHLTRMGRTFFESTMPALVRELERLNENLERVLPAVRAKVEGQQGAEPTQADEREATDLNSPGTDRAGDEPARI